jgi:hypothetical protein
MIKGRHFGETRYYSQPNKVVESQMMIKNAIVAYEFPHMANVELETIVDRVRDIPDLAFDLGMGFGGFGSSNVGFGSGMSGISGMSGMSTDIIVSSNETVGDLKHVATIMNMPLVVIKNSYCDLNSLDEVHEMFYSDKSIINRG